MADLSFTERDCATSKWSAPDIVVPAENYNALIALGSSEWNSKILELANLGDNTEIQMELPPTPEWNQKTGIVLLGLEGSTNGGETWFDLCSSPITIGVKTRFGDGPVLGYECADLPNMRVRIFVNPSVAIRLSAIGTVN